MTDCDHKHFQFAPTSERPYRYLCVCGAVDKDIPDLNRTPQQRKTPPRLAPRQPRTYLKGWNER